MKFGLSDCGWDFGFLTELSEVKVICTTDLLQFMFKTVGLRGKSEDNIKLSSAVEDAIQWDLDRLEELGNMNIMKFNKA
ncbi:hypothetical protein DUI87_10588 [Hirundo rustica rustica]|uniref:Uncharacterized protein n=1 Tax=Hirundo rustica rustica TaxID=333673 RepID=A0A3M0KIJ6_HIRRU|nr:hypothetical protein DUI87_10588 [Hirundo rustica rustica]